MNEIKLTGTLVRDVEYKIFESGSAVARFMLKVPHAHNPKRSNFVPVQIWGDLAGTVADNAKQGSEVSVFGEFESGSYEKDGKKVYTQTINAWACGTDSNKVFSTPRPQPKVKESAGF